MPNRNGKYVAPTWVNGGPPAVDAAEMQAISDAVEGAQMLSGAGNPTASTVAAVGQFYIRTDGGNLWQCIGATGGVYTWKNRDGQAAVLNVLAGSGVLVTLQNGENVMRTTADADGFAVFSGVSYGNWTISATISGSQKTMTYSIETLSFVYVSLLSFDEMTWANVNAVSKTGAASKLLSVGDKKAFVANGTTYYAQVIGFDHDRKTAGGLAGISFQFENCYTTNYPMNSSDTNNGGWKNCAMRTSTMGTLLNQLPSDLRNVIKSVDKVTSVGNKSTNLETTSDKLFLLSEIEIFGSTTYSAAGEGSQYAFYKAGNSRVKKVGSSAASWWERSPNRDNTTNFCFVISDGYANYHAASRSHGVAPGFRKLTTRSDLVTLFRANTEPIAEGGLVPALWLKYPFDAISRTLVLIFYLHRTEPLLRNRCLAWWAACENAYFMAGIAIQLQYTPYNTTGRRGPHYCEQQRETRGALPAQKAKERCTGS